MTRDSGSLGPICPNLLYDYTDMARALKKSPEWFRRNLILNGKVPVVPMGDTYWIYGHALLNALEKEQRTWGVDADPDGRSKSKSSETEDSDSSFSAGATRSRKGGGKERARSSPPPGTDD